MLALVAQHSSVSLCVMWIHVRVEDVSAGQSPGSSHDLPADGTHFVSFRQLLLLYQCEPVGRVQQNIQHLSPYPILLSNCPIQMKVVFFHLFSSVWLTSM